MLKSHVTLCVYLCLCDRVRTTIIEVEYPLIERQLETLDSQIQNAISTLNWTSEGEYDF